uniref:Uncharacterized protein n=1 Tax=Anguilla anguilla TaxID=7936 RepID=A0A0E9UMH2_ANGAN
MKHRPTSHQAKTCETGDGRQDLHQCRHTYLLPRFTYQVYSPTSRPALLPK